jgi:hypothetical protein
MGSGFLLLNTQEIAVLTLLVPLLDLDIGANAHGELSSRKTYILVAVVLLYA